MPSISVLISVYKSDDPAYFDRALESVWSDQTLKPDQIVLIQDGPVGPELEEVILKWKGILSDSLTLLVNDTNEGLTKSLNKGLRFVKGDYIARMDSDDISSPERFQLQKKFLDENPDISVVGSYIQEFNSTHGDLIVRKYALDNRVARIYVCKAAPLAHPAVMMRKSIFDNGISYDERYITSQDIALWFDIFASGLKVSNIPKVLLRFRRDDETLSRRGRRKCIDEFKIYMRGIKRLQGLMTWRYVFPCARLVFRLMPRKFISSIYSGKLRRILLQKNSDSMN